MCCCPHRGEAALLVSIYSVAVSVALLSVLGFRGHQFGPGVSVLTTEILHQICLAIYAVSLTTSLLLLLGLLLPLRPLLLPWLAAHAILCVCLVTASLNYLVLYTQVECGNGDCTVLLGLSASLVIAVLVLLYCLYVVQDWLDMLTHDQGVKRRLAGESGLHIERTGGAAPPGPTPSLPSIAPSLPVPSAPSLAPTIREGASPPAPQTVFTRQPNTGFAIPQTSL